MLAMFISLRLGAYCHSSSTIQLNVTRCNYIISYDVYMSNGWVLVHSVKTHCMNGYVLVWELG